MEYTPNSWVIVKITSDDPHYRVLCSWNGGYLDGDSWKLSSGILDVIESENHYTMPQHSGSTYVIHKAGERMTGIMAGVWSSLTSEEAPAGMSIEILSIEDFLKEWYNKD